MRKNSVFILLGHLFDALMVGGLQRLELRHDVLDRVVIEERVVVLHHALSGLVTLFRSLHDHLGLSLTQLCLDVSTVLLIRIVDITLD